MENELETLYKKYNINTYIEIVKESLGNASNLENDYNTNVFYWGYNDYKYIPLELNIINQDYPIPTSLICTDETEKDDDNNKTVLRTYMRPGNENYGKAKESITLDDKGNLVNYCCHSMYGVSINVDAVQGMVGVEIKKDTSHNDYDSEPEIYYIDFKRANAIIALNDQGSLDVELNYYMFKDKYDEYGGSVYAGTFFDSTDKVIVEKPSNFKIGSSEEKKCYVKH